MNQLHCLLNSICEVTVGDEHPRVPDAESVDWVLHGREVIIITAREKTNEIGVGMAGTVINELT